MKERREENLNISDCRNGGNKMKQGEKRGTKKGEAKEKGGRNSPSSIRQNLS